MSSSDGWLTTPGPMAHPDATGSHTRFIPREELTDESLIAKWQPRVFGRVVREAPTQAFHPMADAPHGVPVHRKLRGSLPADQDFTHLSHAAQAGATVEDPNAQPRPKAGSHPSAAAHGAPVADQAMAGDTASAAEANDVAEAVDADEGITEAQREQLLAEWRAEADAALEAQLNEARQSGYQDGYRDGMVALDSFKESFAQQMSSRVADLLAAMDREWQQLEDMLGERVTRIAVELGRQVVRSELQQRPSLIEAVAQEALGALMKQARQVRIQLHPDDHALVADHCAETVQALGARLVAQPQVQRGGCQVVSDLGTIDARIETRWQMAAQALGDTLPWTDSAPPAPLPETLPPSPELQAASDAAAAARAHAHAQPRARGQLAELDASAAPAVPAAPEAPPATAHARDSAASARPPTPTGAPPAAKSSPARPSIDLSDPAPGIEAAAPSLQAPPPASPATATPNADPEAHLQGAAGNDSGDGHRGNADDGHHGDADDAPPDGARP